jgi:hypothetical protein
LGHSEFREQVTEAYHSIMKVRMGMEGILLASLDAMVRGDARALQQVRFEARRQWQEIEEVARREMLSSLPITIEELIEQLEDPRGEDDIEGWADALGATGACGVCGTTVIRPYSFAEAAVRHYGISEADADNAHEQIETALCASGIETGGWGDGSLCAYHNEQAVKDD